MTSRSRPLSSSFLSISDLQCAQNDRCLARSIFTRTIAPSYRIHPTKEPIIYKHFSTDKFPLFATLCSKKEKASGWVFHGLQFLYAPEKDPVDLSGFGAITKAVIRQPGRHSNDKFSPAISPFTYRPDLTVTEEHLLRGGFGTHLHANRDVRPGNARWVSLPPRQSFLAFPRIDLPHPRKLILLGGWIE
jgi:hypothetical protein